MWPDEDIREETGAVPGAAGDGRGASVLGQASPGALDASARSSAPSASPPAAELRAEPPGHPSAPDEPPAAPPALGEDGAPRGGWDFALMVATIALLGGLGVQSFIGTIYAWWMSRAMPGWEDLVAHDIFIGWMNAIAAPMVVGLVVVLGLCVPKRLLTRRALVAVSAAMLAAGAGVALAKGSVATGLAAYLALASLLQVAVVVMTLAGAPSLRYLGEGRLTKTGSGLLHLGFLLFALAVLVQKTAYMMPVFWVCAACTTVGTTLSFYARPIARRLGA